MNKIQSLQSIDNEITAGVNKIMAQANIIDLQEKKSLGLLTDDEKIQYQLEIEKQFNEIPEKDNENRCGKIASKLIELSKENAGNWERYSISQLINKEDTHSVDINALRDLIDCKGDLKNTTQTLKSRIQDVDVKSFLDSVEKIKVVEYNEVMKKKTLSKRAKLIIVKFK